MATFSLKTKKKIVVNLAVWALTILGKAERIKIRKDKNVA